MNDVPPGLEPGESLTASWSIRYDDGGRIQ
jgi:hypothetical protein